MSKDEKVANIMCFLALIAGDSPLTWECIMDFSPNYLIEKFERYVLSGTGEYLWGLHPDLRNVCFNTYVKKWNLEISNE